MLPYADDGLERTVTLPAGRVTLEGTLGIPADARGIVLFAHGSGSSRFSPRNRYVARDWFLERLRATTMQGTRSNFDSPLRRNPSPLVEE